jgi:hypothetical protein
MIWIVRHTTLFSAGFVSVVEIERKKTGFHARPAGENPGQADGGVGNGARFHLVILFMSFASFAYYPSTNKARIQGERIKLTKIFYGIAFYEALGLVRPMLAGAEITNCGDNQAPN